MSFFASVKKLFTKTKRRKESEKGVEMLGNIKPVYTRKVVGVSPKRQHRIMNSPPLRNKTNRRARHHLGQLSPIKSRSTPSSPHQSIYMPMSRSKSKSMSKSKSKTMSKSKSMSKSSSKPKSKSMSKSSSKPRSKSKSMSKSKSSSKPRSKSSSKPRSRSMSLSRSPLPPLQIPKSSSYNSSNSNTRRKRQRGQRGQRRNRHPNYEKRKIYRARLKTSTCRKIKPGAKCKLRTECKYAMGNIRQFCRKRKNMRVRHYTG